MKSRRVGSVRRCVADVAIEIGITCAETAWIVGCPFSRGGVVVTRVMELQARFRIQPGGCGAWRSACPLLLGPGSVWLDCGSVGPIFCSRLMLVRVGFRFRALAIRD